MHIIIQVVTRAMKDGVAGIVMVPNDFDKVGSAITLCKWLPGVLYCAAGTDLLFITLL
jgi:hypothetical protein